MMMSDTKASLRHTKPQGYIYPTQACKIHVNSCHIMKAAPPDS